MGRSDDRSVVESEAGEDRKFLEYLGLARDVRLGDEIDVPTAAMWNAVDAATRKRARIYSLGSWRAAAAIAAVVVILVSFVALRLTSNRATLLLAADAGVPEVYVAEDGSNVTLRPNSELYRERRTGRYRLSGEAYFDVATQVSGQFVVLTENASVTVLGTRFVVSDWSNGTGVYLEEGSVRLGVSGTDESVVLAPGEYRAVIGSSVSSRERVGPAEAMDWLQGDLVFESRPVSVVARELSFHFGVQIVVSESYASEFISGRILLDSRRDALNDLAVILDGRVEESDGGFSLVPRER
jgi:transmembrane sensor